MFCWDFAWRRDEMWGADLARGCSCAPLAIRTRICVASGLRQGSSVGGVGGAKMQDGLIGEWDNFTLVFSEQVNEMFMVVQGFGYQRMAAARIASPLSCVRRGLVNRGRGDFCRARGLILSATINWGVWSMMIMVRKWRHVDA